jgi:hypothetical protein
MSGALQLTAGACDAGLLKSDGPENAQGMKMLKAMQATKP